MKRAVAFQFAWIVCLCGIACSQIAGFDEFRGEGGARASEAGRSSSDGGGARNTNSEAGGEGGTSDGHGAGGAGPTAGGAAGKRSSGAAGGFGGGGSNRAGSNGTGGTNAGGGAGFGGAGGSTGCNQSLLLNGDFEAATANWDFTTDSLEISFLTEIIVRREDGMLPEAGYTADPLAGEYFAWLGGTKDPWGVYQTLLFQENIRIPRETTRLVLSGQIQIKTQEPPVDHEDFLEARLENTTIRLHFRPDPNVDSNRWSNLNATTGWEHFEALITEPDEILSLRGAVVSLHLESLVDEVRTTSFWLDSVSLVAECGR